MSIDERLRRRALQAVLMCIETFGHAVLFVDRDYFTVTPAYSPKHMRYEHLRPEKKVGEYNKKVLASWIVDDLAQAGAGQ